MSEVRSIPEPGPIGDGQPQQGGHSGGRQQPPAEEPAREHPLLQGRDEVQLSSHEAGGMLLFHECVLRAVEEELGCKLASLRPRVVLDEHPDPSEIGDLLCSELATLLQWARSQGLPDPGETVRTAAQRGTAEAMDLLADKASDPLATLLASWADKLTRLAQKP